MKTKFALCVTIATLGSALSSAAVAQQLRMRAGPPMDAALPPYEINTIVRSMGFDPLTNPQRRGPYYVLNAIDPRGIEMRVVADARMGAVVSIMPAAMRYDGGPRIIHIPQDSVGALPDDQDDADLTPEERNDPRQYGRPRYDDPRITTPAPAPRKPPVKSAAVPPAASASAPSAPAAAASAPPVSHAPPRAVLAPPQSLSDGPTPIRPLPKLGKTERFSSPDPKTTATLPPPSAPQPDEADANEAAKPTETPSNKSIEMTPVAPLD